MRKRVRGSYTVEAVFLFPILLFLIIFMLQIAINWEEKVQRAAEDTSAVVQLETREYFLDEAALHAMKEQVKNYGN